MKVGINGMGRIARLALRSAMGAAERRGVKSEKLSKLRISPLTGIPFQRPILSSK
jgi:glyceraldehyde-3-phosphate dehydrogenase/erythrose-4-phosphate dehydrogenase